jgi:hypothetical protein
MAKTEELVCRKTSWQGRQAFVLENGQIRLVTLLGGGHIAELRFLDSLGVSTINPLWRPPWKTLEPFQYREKKHARTYGPPPVGALHAGVIGHNLCLDYFGAPSDNEAKQGLPIHGEAGVLRWRLLRARVTARESRLELGVRLPVAGVRFSRQIRLTKGESVAYIREEVVNENKHDHFFHWTQHVTFGPPFLNAKDSRVFISATRGRTFPHGYEGKALFESSQDFRWPNAPGVKGKSVDLRRPLSNPGLGFVATVLMDPRRDQQYVAALNMRERVLIAYCFDRKDFPWTAIWEENRARKEMPWNRETETRGLEFSSTPFPVGRREAFANGPLFGAPYFSMVPARAKRTVQYVAFLIQVPQGFDQVGDIRLSEGEIQVNGAGPRSRDTLPVKAEGLGSHMRGARS